MDPIHTFVGHLGRARYEDLSAKVVETVKMSILDTMGAALAGSASEAGRSIARIAKGYGGGTGSTVVVHGGKVAPPLAVLAAKEAVNRAFELSLEAGLEFGRKNFFLLFASEDQREGMAAFIEKRKPDFKGN